MVDSRILVRKRLEKLAVFFVVEYQETRRAPNEEVLEAPVLHDYQLSFLDVRLGAESQQDR